MVPLEREVQVLRSFPAQAYLFKKICCFSHNTEVNRHIVKILLLCSDMVQEKMSVHLQVLLVL